MGPWQFHPYYAPTWRTCCSSRQWRFMARSVCQMHSPYSVLELLTEASKSSLLLYDGIGMFEDTHWQYSMEINFRRLFMTLLTEGLSQCFFGSHIKWQRVSMAIFKQGPGFINTGSKCMLQTFRISTLNRFNNHLFWFIGFTNFSKMAFVLINSSFLASFFF